MFTSLSPIIKLATNSYSPRQFEINNQATPCGLLYRFIHDEKLNFQSPSALNWRNELFISDRRGNIFKIDLSKGEYVLNFYWN